MMIARHQRSGCFQRKRQGEAVGQGDPFPSPFELAGGFPKGRTVNPLRSRSRNLREPLSPVGDLLAIPAKKIVVDLARIDRVNEAAMALFQEEAACYGCTFFALQERHHGTGIKDVDLFSGQTFSPRSRPLRPCAVRIPRWTRGDRGRSLAAGATGRAAHRGRVGERT